MKYKIFIAIIAIAILAVMFCLRHEQNDDNTPTEEIIADIPPIIYTHNCMPMTLINRGVSKKCFNNANTGEDKYCSKTQLQIIKEYYDKEEWKTDPNYGTDKFCAE